MTVAGRKPMRARMKTYKVSLHVEETIHAEDREEALGIVWDEVERDRADGEMLAGGELAKVEEVK